MKIDRLLGILSILMQKERVTAPYLAEKFEVSRRTIGRDIDALCRAGIPVTTYQGGGGGIGILDGYKHNISVLTFDELSGIIAALKGIGSVSEKSNIERTLSKLGANKDTALSLREPIVIDLASHYKGSLTDKIGLIKKAIQEQRLIGFDYYYEKGTSHRCAEPYFVIFQWAAWYVFCYCLDRGDFRLFKLTRLWNLTLLDGRYAPREIPPERRDFSAHLPDDKRLVALFDPSVKYLLIDTYGLNCYTEDANGLLRLTVGYTNRDYMIAWLLGFGDKVKVLEPIDIACAIREKAEKIVEQYN